MTTRVLPTRDASEVLVTRPQAVDSKTLEESRTIVEEVRRDPQALRRYAVAFQELGPEDPLVLTRDDLLDVLSQISEADRALLERTADRIRTFAQAQRDALHDMEIEIPGGRAGHRIEPVEVAGCYAPGGRFPLPSSVLMTAITASVAGVEEIWVASPKPTKITLAAAAIAGADYLLCAGGAHAIAAMAYGTAPVHACDVIVGPGNRWVTAAKQIVHGSVGIDMLAGPSELVVLADHSADPNTVAADLLAQAEHDEDAVPILVTTSRQLAEDVDRALDAQLQDLPTHAIARKAIAGQGYVVVVSTMEEAIEICDRLAPEHLEVITENPEEVARKVRHFGGLFIGSNAAEVLGDYGAGPNHTLPTGGTARFTGGLCVMDFLRIRTWMQIDDPQAAQVLVHDAVSLARHEGLEAHARSANCRRTEENKG